MSDILESERLSGRNNKVSNQFLDVKALLRKGRTLGMFGKDPCKGKVARSCPDVMVFICNGFKLVGEDDVFVEVLFEEARHLQSEVVRIEICSGAIPVRRGTYLL